MKKGSLKLLVSSAAIAMMIMSGGCGAKEAQTSVDITPTEPVLEETETKETETQETETKETETEVIEEVKIDEAKAQELIKAYSKEVEESDIKDYYDELVYAFMTNYNNGDDADKAFESALEHAKELKEFDKAEEEKKQAEIDTKKREEEANKKAEEEAKQESTQAEEAKSNKQENGSTGSDNSVPVTAEEAQQSEPAPAPSQPQQSQSTNVYSSGAMTQEEMDRRNAEAFNFPPDDPEYGVTYGSSEGLPEVDYSIFE